MDRRPVKRGAALAALLLVVALRVGRRSQRIRWYCWGRIRCHGCPAQGQGRAHPEQQGHPARAGDSSRTHEADEELRAVGGRLEALPGRGGTRAGARRRPGLLRVHAQLGVQPAPPQVRRHASRASGQATRTTSASTSSVAQARHHHVPGLRLLRDRAARVHAEAALGPARRRRCAATSRSTRGRTRRATTPSSRIRSTTSARPSSPPRTARCA